MTHFSKTVFKDNGEPIMLNEDGSRSIFCDIADDMDDTTVESAPSLPCKIAEYSVTAAALGQLRAKYERVLFPVTTTPGMKDAIAARAELRGLRIGLESMRKEIKAPALERTRLIDAEAKQITAELVALEDPIHAQIKAEENRKEAEKAERDRIAAERKAAIMAKIDAIRSIPMAMAGESSSEIDAEINGLRAFEPDESFAEFSSDATAAAHTAIITLIGMREKQGEIEVAAARAEAERIAAAEAALAAAIESKRIADAQAIEAKRLVDLAEKIEEAAKALAIQNAADQQRMADEMKALLDAQQAQVANERKQHDDAARALREQQDAERAQFEAEKQAFADKQVKIASDAEAARAEIVRKQMDEFKEQQSLIVLTADHTEALADNEQWNFDQAVDQAEFERIHAEALAMNEDRDANAASLIAPKVEVATLPEIITDLIFTMRCLIHNINGGSFESIAQAVDAAYASIARAEWKAA